MMVMMVMQLARDALLVHGPLAHRLGIHQLRNELETVAFGRLFPQQFNKVPALCCSWVIEYKYGT